MSIASYKMATSPYDSNNKNVLDWLDRMETSVRMAGRSAGPGAYKDIRGGTTAIDDEDSGEEESHAKRFGLVPPDDDDQTVGHGEHTVADEKMSSLPDSHVPLGLIANLSLSSNKGKKPRKESKDIAGAEENLDDDDVVRSSCPRDLLLDIDSFLRSCEGSGKRDLFFAWCVICPVLVPIQFFFFKFGLSGPATDLGMRAMLIEQHSPPEILVHGLVVPEDVDKLFEM